MANLDLLAIAQVHVDSAGQAGVEAAYGPHDIDSLEVVRPVFLEDRRVLHRIFVRPRRPEGIARAGIPARGRIGMIIGDFPLANDHVMRQQAAHRFVEAAAQPFLGNLELRPGFGASGVDSFQGPSKKYRAAAAAYAWK
jgi:hypothetical protein